VLKQIRRLICPPNASRAGTPGPYAETEAEARARFQRWRHVDPYAQIDPALLNSADIADYAAATGMIHPFDPQKLKPASYAFALGGKVLWWDNKTREHSVVTLTPDDEFELQPNSIAFVTLEPLIQLPDYIALRFNLRIRNVYRGLLLGTGPLVDPGWEGQLSFPLHNLTTNPYRFRGGEDVIWVEFTKLSRNASWAGERGGVPARVGAYRPYRAPAGRSDVEDYVAEALSHKPSGHIWSSISEALRDAHHAIGRARFINITAVAGIVALAIAVLGVAGSLLWNQFDLPRTSQVQNDERSIAELRAELKSLSKELATLRAQARSSATQAH
jgi:deoxycytidine triphosphate deaminase